MDKKFHISLGEYYFFNKSICESASTGNIDPAQLEKIVLDINTRSISALHDFYSQKGSLGFVATQYNLTRNELLGFMARYEFNLSDEDIQSRIRIDDIKSGKEKFKL